MKKLVAIIYQSFNDRGIDDPYFRTMTMLVMIVIMHIAHLSLISNISYQKIFPFSSGDARFFLWLQGIIFFSAILILFYVVFRKSKLERIPVTEKQIERANKLFPVYLVSCILLLGILLVRHGVNRGMIHF